MKRTTLKFKKVVLPSATLRDMKAATSLRIPTESVKTSSLRMIASRLKNEGYLFKVSSKGLISETIVECIKTPEL